MNSRTRNMLLIIGAVIVAAVGGGFASRMLAPSARPRTDTAPRRPIIQIVRQQPGLPSIADAVASLCPSIAAIAPAGADGPVVAGFAISADGWVMASSANLPTGAMDVHFADGPALPVSEVRKDAVSGFSLVKTDATDLHPVPLADQNFPRVGDFGFTVLDPAASGCSAQMAMIASDFLTDGGAPSAYIRLQAMGADLPPGAPFISTNSEVIGVVAANGQADSVIPSDIVADVSDELLRDNLSPTTRFGFRAKDFDSGLSARLGGARSAGTEIALVQPKSPAFRAGLRAGDTVIAVDGSPVASASELGRALDAAGKSASLDIARADQRLTLSIGRVPGS